MPRWLDATARLLAADPGAVQPHLARWLADERRLPATPDATVATAAQALLYTHRHGDLDGLTDVLADSPHPRAAELLAVLAEEEPSALCRAAERWARDERPARRAAAMTYGLRAAARAGTEADRELLRAAALTLLERPDDPGSHGGALALLILDPRTRPRHLPEALRRFVSGDPHLPPDALVPALATDPEPVLDAFRDRLLKPGAQAALRTLAEVTAPALGCRIGALVREAGRRHPESADAVAEFVRRRLEHGPRARAVLVPLVTGLLEGGPAAVRAALAAVLATPGTSLSRPLRDELLDRLLARESDAGVLETVLREVAGSRHEDGEPVQDAVPGAVRGAAGGRSERRLREVVHRVGVRLSCVPDGEARFDRALADLCLRVPGFTALVARWLTADPGEWAEVIGPATLHLVENLAGARVPA